MMIRDFNRWMILCIIVLLVGGSALIMYSAHSADTKLRNDLLLKTRLSALGISADKVGALNGTETDLSSPEYLLLKDQLTKIRAANPRCRFSYLIGQRGDGTPFFFVDSEPVDSEDYSPPGQIYPEASIFLKNAFINGSEGTEGPLDDRWGTWVSSFIPIKDPATGSVIAVFGEDVDAGDWNLQIASASLPVVAGTSLVIILVFVFLYAQQRNILEKQILADSAASIQKSEEEFRTLAENNQDYIMRYDRNHRHTYANPACLRVSGKTRDEFIGRTHRDMGFPPELCDLWESAVDRVFETGQQYGETFTWASAEGEVILDWRLFAEKDSSGRVKSVMGVARDITEIKRAEEAIRNSERQLRDIINFIPDATFAINREGKIIAWNRAIEKMTGVRAQDMLGKGDHEYGIPFYGERRPILIDLVLKEDDEIKKKYPAIEKKGDKFISEIFIQRLYGGKGAHLWFIVSPLYDTQNNVIGAIESIRDVSDRKRAEEALRTLTEELADKVKERTSELEKTNVLLEGEIRYHREAEHRIQQSLDEKVILLREIHHRVKNNLQVIISILNLQSRYVRDSKSIEALSDCQNRVKAMAMVHERLYQTHDISRINVSGYIRDLTQILFHFYGFSLKSINLDIDVENISVDINTAIPMGLIINELFSNALKYAFPEGRPGKISVKIKKDGDMISVVFADDGVGIPADLDWRNSPSLGLKLVISLVEQLMGTIEMHRDNGTRFDILLKEKKSREV